jgi:N-acetylmuramoyl-L-alanine amidase
MPIAVAGTRRHKSGPCVRRSLAIVSFDKHAPSSVEHTRSSVEHYRRERKPCSREFGTELARITDEIEDPVAKLRYLRGAIETADDALVSHLPFPPARRAWYRWRGLEALDAVLDPTSDEATAIGDRTLTARRTARRVVAGAVATTLLLAPALLAGLALQINTKSSEPATTVNVAPTPTPAPASAPAGVTAPALAPVAEELPQDVMGLMPTTIWLADRGSDWELYSNGLRIETGQAVKGPLRRFRVHDRAGGLQKEVYSKPVGILYHTSESDLWPLEENFERQLRRSSAGLLRYVRKEQAYNYLIDRFGRVYRVVDEETRAKHAGRAVWARNDEVYLDLNNAFIGVSFESRWENGRTLPITRAQLIAGRNLTHLLRQRFAIAPEMCVTHGLTSVNAKQMLIGYHRDWARGFPFDAFGLPDLYAQPTPSVALFGFGYDDHFLRSIGERWPGLVAAEQLLANDARERSMSVDALRRERQELYLKWAREAPESGNAAGESMVVEVGR